MWAILSWCTRLSRGRAVRASKQKCVSKPKTCCRATFVISRLPTLCTWRLTNAAGLPRSALSKLRLTNKSVAGQTPNAGERSACTTPPPPECDPSYVEQTARGGSPNPGRLCRDRVGLLAKGGTPRRRAHRVDCTAWPAILAWLHPADCRAELRTGRGHCLSPRPGRPTSS